MRHRYSDHLRVPVRGAGVLVVARDTGRVLLARRSCLVSDPGVWGVPGGTVDPGEVPREAAVRELEEEAGLWAVDVSGDPVHVAVGGDSAYAIYLGVVPREVAPILNWESDLAGWFDREDLPAGAYPSVGVAVDRLRVGRRRAA